MIVGSLCVAFGTLLFAVPLGVGCAVFLSEFASRKVVQVVKPYIELLFAIPSEVYGFMGVAVLVPLIRDYLGGTGFSILASSIVLGIMILPAMWEYLWTHYNLSQKKLPREISCPWGHNLADHLVCRASCGTIRYHYIYYPWYGLSNGRDNGSHYDC
jgi:ABC-type uncharacterized transport system permease subunit